MEAIKKAYNIFKKIGWQYKLLAAILMLAGAILGGWIFGKITAPLFRLVVAGAPYLWRSIKVVWLVGRIGLMIFCWITLIALTGVATYKGRQNWKTMALLIPAWLMILFLLWIPSEARNLVFGIAGTWLIVRLVWQKHPKYIRVTVIGLALVWLTVAFWPVSLLVIGFTWLLTIVYLAFKKPPREKMDIFFIFLWPTIYVAIVILVVSGKYEHVSRKAEKSWFFQIGKPIKISWPKGKPVWPLVLAAVGILVGIVFAHFFLRGPAAVFGWPLTIAITLIVAGLIVRHILLRRAEKPAPPEETPAPPAEEAPAREPFLHRLFNNRIFQLIAQALIAGGLIWGGVELLGWGKTIWAVINYLLIAGVTTWMAWTWDGFLIYILDWEPLKVARSVKILWDRRPQFDFEEKALLFFTVILTGITLILLVFTPARMPNAEAPAPTPADTAELEALRAENARLRDDLESVRKDLTTQVNARDDEIRLIQEPQAELDEALAANAELSATLGIRRSELENYDSALKKTRDERDALQVQLDTARADFESCASDLVTANEEAQAELKQLQLEYCSVLFFHPEFWVGGRLDEGEGPPTGCERFGTTEAIEEGWVWPER